MQVRRWAVASLAASAVAISACGSLSVSSQADSNPTTSAAALAATQTCEATELAIRDWTKQTSPAIWEFDAIVHGLSVAEIPTLEAANRFEAVALRFSEVLAQAEPHAPAFDLTEAYDFFIDGLHEMEEAARAAAMLTDPPVSGLPAEAITSRDSAVALFFESNAAANPCG